MTHWPLDKVELVLELKGRVSTRAAERITGIPHPTISSWWAGRSDPFYSPRGRTQRPRQRCLQGHPLTSENTYINPGSGRRQCKQCRRKVWRRANWLRRGVFHPVHNPNVELAPVEQLWYWGPDVLAELLETTTYSELYNQLDPTGQRKLTDIKAGRRRWSTYDTVDRMCLALGFPASALETQPIYGKHPNALKEPA